jgi:type IV pilus assembly protein PilQ
MRRAGNVLWIAPKDEIAAKEKLELESQAAIQTLEPLRTQAFVLNYTKAADVAVQLTGSGAVPHPQRSRQRDRRAAHQPAVRHRRAGQAGTRCSSLTSGWTSQVPARCVIEALHRPKPPTAWQEPGRPAWAASDLRGRARRRPRLRDRQYNRVALGGTYDAVRPRPAKAATPLTHAQHHLREPAVGRRWGGFSPSTFAISIFSSAANRFLNLELSALEADGKGKLVSSPRIVTADKTKALIEQGTEFPYQQATSSGATSVAFRRATLKLEVTPQITPEGNIILDLDIAKDSRGETTAAGIAINTKHIKTQVLVENGGTVVIGGIFELTETENETRVPLLGDIPVAGNLFKNRSRSTTKQEMLVFITPKMVADRQSAGR